jgi:N-acetylglutamate synthase-like GNAT family acetyltransferase
MKNIVRSGEVPGILAYHGKNPIGWCSVAPRDRFPVLSRSRVLKPVDEKEVWSISCFFIEKSYRRSGVSVQFLNFLKKYGKERGVRILEGYSVQPKKGEMPDVFAWTGLRSAFLQAGFKEVARRSETRPIMRYSIRR